MNRLIYHILIGFIILSACRTAVIDHTESKFIPLKNDTLGIDSVIYKLILPYKVKVDAAMDEQIAISDTAMPAPDRKVVPMESLLGNFVADVFMKVGNELYKKADSKGIDFVLINTGGIRTSLPKGVLTTRNIFELLPFDNRLTVVSISGDSLQSLFRYIAKKGGDPVSGLSLGIKDGKPVDPIIQGKPFDSNATYNVLTNDFCAAGGDLMWFFTGAAKYTDLNLILRDAVINELKLYTNQGKHVTAALDNRIYHAR